MIRVLLVDDHELVRQGIRRILEISGDMEVVGEAASGEEAIRQAQEHRPDIVLMDVQMPGVGGIAATRKISQMVPTARIIALTVFERAPFPAQLHDAGARGYVTKGCPAEEMLTAIRDVHSGKRYVATSVARRHTLEELEGKQGTPVERLSSRELQVLMMILNGHKTQDISDYLCVSPKTVSTHKQRILLKLGVDNEIELARFAYRYGLIPDER